MGYRSELPLSFLWRRNKNEINFAGFPEKGFGPSIFSVLAKLEIGGIVGLVVGAGGSGSIAGGEGASRRDRSSVRRASI